MKIALLSDIHGNCIALDAVLADIDAQGGADETWVLGDLVAVGTQPVETLEQLAQVPNVRFTRGNTDDYMIHGTRPKPFAEDVQADFGRLPVYEEVARTMAWTQGALMATGWMPFLDELPLEQHATLPDGTTLLGVHASPGENNGRGIRPDYADEEVARLFPAGTADLICVGHTHWPMQKQINDTHIVNVGSVGNARIADLNAWYALLHADESGYRVEPRSVPFDREAAIQMVAQKRHPAGGFILKFLRGERVYPFDGPYP